jgi:uncharacterized membrane protein YgcG
VDVEESLVRLGNLHSNTVLSRRRPSRRWKDSHRDSEAATVMMAYWPQWGATNTANGAMTGVDAGSSFGGGFSSGGGASGGY